MKNLKTLFLLCYMGITATCASAQSDEVGKVENGNYIITIDTDSIETEWEKLLPGADIVEFSIVQRWSDNQKAFYLLLGESSTGQEFGSPLNIHGGKFSFQRLSGGGTKTVTCSCASSGLTDTVGCNIKQLKSGSYYCSACTGTCSKTESISISN